MRVTTPRDAARLIASMRQDRSRREGRLRKLSTWICPWRGRFGDQPVDPYDDGRERFTHAASQAALSGASGMTSGMTPRNISWFKPSFQDAALEELSGVRQWLDSVDSAMKDCLAEGGFYQAIQNFNLDLIWAGCALLYSETGRENTLEFTCVQPGTYLVQTDSLGRIEACARHLSFSHTEAAEIFGTDAFSRKAELGLRDKPLSSIGVWHLVLPTPKEEIREEGQFTCRSFYWEDGKPESFLRESGFHEMPFFFARWNDGATAYGTGPGDFCLADAMQLHKLELRKLEGLGKLVDPPVACPPSLKDSIDLGPGAVNFVSERQPITSILDLGPYAQAFSGITSEIAVVSARLQQGLMASIFSSMPLDQRPAGMSATEFLERKREALQQLGPVISAYEPRVLTPLLFRVVRTLEREGKLPPPPRELGGGGLFMKMDFISPMANALRQTGAETTRALFQDMALMYQATRKEELFDKIDLDQIVDELARGVGCPGSIVRADADVEAIRQQRAKARAAQAQMALALQAARAAPAGSDSGSMGDVPAGPAGGMAGNASPGSQEGAPPSQSPFVEGF